MPRKKASKKTSKKANKKTSKKVGRKKKTARKRKKVTAGWTRAQISKLHECWKETPTRKACLSAVEQALPEMPPPVAWDIIRKLSKSDREWMLTARQKARDKAESKVKKERKKAERVRNREVRKKKQAVKDKRAEIGQCLEAADFDKVAECVGEGFFFCPDIHQQMNTAVCIFRVFAPSEECGVSHGQPCSSCRRMDKYMAQLERMIDEKQVSG